MSVIVVIIICQDNPSSTYNEIFVMAIQLNKLETSNHI